MPIQAAPPSCSPADGALPGPPPGWAYRPSRPSLPQGPARDAEGKERAGGKDGGIEKETKRTAEGHEEQRPREEEEEALRYRCKARTGASLGARNPTWWLRPRPPQPGSQGSSLSLAPESSFLPALGGSWGGIQIKAPAPSLAAPPLSHWGMNQQMRVFSLSLTQILCLANFSENKK